LLNDGLSAWQGIFKREFATGQVPHAVSMEVDLQGIFASQQPEASGDTSADLVGDFSADYYFIEAASHGCEAVW
jgi:hypothetical protein